MFGRFWGGAADNVEGMTNAEETQAVLFKNDRRVIRLDEFFFTSLVLNHACCF